MFHDYGVVNFWTFLAGALVIVMVPGPNSLYVLRTGISRGIRAAYRGLNRPGKLGQFPFPLRVIYAKYTVPIRIESQGHPMIC